MAVGGRRQVVRVRRRAARSARIVTTIAATAYYTTASGVGAREPGALGFPAPADTVPGGTDSLPLGDLRFRYIGPEGNRISAVAGVAGDPNVYYAGAASGGIFKTTDGGTRWTAVFDAQPVSSIGALAVAPSDARVVWAGTGEAFIRSNVSLGWGIYKSTDAGATWTRMGLDQTGRIARVAIDPHDPNRVYVAAVGRGYGPQSERGVYRTTDGGATWARVLFVNDSTGASDIVIDPTEPRTLYAGTWQLEMHTWGRRSGGAGSGVWKSTDGGTTWRRLGGNGLPTALVGKIGLAMSRADPRRVYALIETGGGVPNDVTDRPDHGVLWRSDDAGARWERVSSDRQLAGRPHYYTRMAVMPDNADEAFFASGNWAKTTDGGRTTIDPPRADYPGGDQHDIWIDPADANRMIVGHDHGLSISPNRGRTWRRIELPVAQMYHVTVDDRVPYNVYGNRQDGQSYMGPANARLSDFDGGFDPVIPRAAWRTVGGDESGWATPDPVDTTLVWSSGSGYGSVGGVVTRYDVRTGMAHAVELWPRATIGSPAGILRYRFGWTFPLTISPHDHRRVYAGSQYLHVTTDGGHRWTVISPDLTRNDRRRQGSSGGLTPDNLGPEYAGVLSALVESPKARGVMWAGTNDGLVHLTRDGGRTWTDVSARVPRLPVWGTIANIEPSRWDAGTAYLAVDAHQEDDRGTYVYRTRDFGRTWSLITTGVPQTPLSYAHVIREDPVRRGLLYLGTENGLYVSLDDGERWHPMQLGLPRVPVYWLTVQDRFADLVVATYGRGFWVLDDITPLRELAPAATDSALHLFAPRTTYRLRPAEPPLLKRDEDPVAGRNPPQGAAISYWLRTSHRAVDSVTADSVTIAIADGRGRTIRTIRGPAHAGVNRVWWDLRGESTARAWLRTSPRYAPWVTVPPAGRAAPGVGRYSALVPPGRYVVTVRYAGAERRRPLELRKDPSSGGSDETIRWQAALLATIRSDIDSAVALVNRLERVRAQLEPVRQTTTGSRTDPELRAAAAALDEKLRGVEELLFQTRVTGRGQDLVRWPMRLAEQLLYLAESVGSSDYAPTAAQTQVSAELHQELSAAGAAARDALTRGVDRYDVLLRARGLPLIARS